MLSNILTFLFYSIFSLSIAPLNFSQVIDDFTCGTDFDSAYSSKYPPKMNGVKTGGKQITNQGVLRVLVIFVRFSDDNLTTSDWPNQHVLPSWAANFINTQVPLPGSTYTAKNLSDFFDRASGGDGNGNLGMLRIIGDIYYVTIGPRSSYSNDGSVNTAVWSLLDQPDIYDIDFSLYDNWTFMKNGENYNHENVPDGKVDYIFMNWRERSISRGSEVLGIKTLWSSYTTNDGVTIGSNGSTQYYYRDRGLFNADDIRLARTIWVPAHEFLHWIYGGLHLDRELQFFAVMTPNTLGSICAYEKFRAGWLTPDEIITNNSFKLFPETHIKNKAIRFPIRYDVNNNKVEYFLLENYHTTNEYPGANPFLRKQIFDHTLTHGILVYHNENESLDDPMSSTIDIECADGLWQWLVIEGANTPSDRTDDKIGHGLIGYYQGFDEGDKLSILVGQITYTDYFALRASDNGCGTGNPCNSPCTPQECNHGWRYYKSSYLGDNEDFFRFNINDVFSRYSNPAAYLANHTPKDVGFEIKSYNSTTKEYALSVQVTNTGILSLKPSRPQNLQYTIIEGQYGGDSATSLTWSPNLEPDMQVTGAKYKIFRALNDNPYQLLVTIDAFVNGSPVTNWIDWEPCHGGSKLYYAISAVDNTQKESVKSEAVWRYGRLCKGNNEEVEESIPENFLSQNFPNPFNPMTVIKYSVKEAGFVSLKVFDILGREMITLVNELKPLGISEAKFDASNLPGGVYFYTLTSKEFHQTKKMLLIK